MHTNVGLSTVESLRLNMEHEKGRGVKNTWKDVDPEVVFLSHSLSVALPSMACL